ncbi:MAG: hypothetical protein ABIG34_02375 [Candidatus Peregrinibacteria bacterium]
MSLLYPMSHDTRSVGLALLLSTLIVVSVAVALSTLVPQHTPFLMCML